MITRTLLRPSSPSRRLTARLGWLMVAAVAVWALFGGAAFVGATHTEPLPLTLVAADNECQEAGFDFGWKLDGIDELHAGPYTFSNEAGTVTGSITFTGDDDPDNPDKNQPTGYTDLVVNPPHDGILEKRPVEGGGISHLTFCYNTPEETTAPPEETTAPPEETTAPPEETTAPPEETATPTGTEVGGTPTPTPSETVAAGTPTPTPVETVAGATPTPVITPPSTSTETPAGGATQSGLLLVLLLLGMGTTGLLVFSPRLIRSR